MNTQLRGFFNHQIHGTGFEEGLAEGYLHWRRGRDG
jgi:hypothetical protein